MPTVIVRREPVPLVELPDALSPVLRRVYAARRVRCSAELETGLDRLVPPDPLLGIEQAVELLADAVRGDRRILFVADFDADGATSCAVGVRALRAMGARQVGFVVPNRFEYGYGLTPEIVAVAAERRPDLLITVDNGISSVEGVAEARRRGIRTLITDHHLPGAELPAADAIVNPNQPGDRFPSKHLAGVGVIFYVMSALRAELRRQGWFRERGAPEPNLAGLLDLVALGTVADVVPLDHNNRILVHQGLRRMRAGRCAAGITALARVGGRDQARLVAADIGFALAPRLNAAGRLEDMAFGIECLLCDDPSRALEMATRLDALNRERRDIEAQMQEQAVASLDRLQLAERDLPFGLCLHDPQWHQGVIGILAGRIRERTHRPVVAFAEDRDGMLKGSARSVAGVHIRDALDAVAKRNPALIDRFGGHAMAAGLSLRAAGLDAFRDAFDFEIRRHLAPEDLRGCIYSDGELGLAELSLDTAEVLREAGPWGQAFPEPTFDGVFETVSHRILKDKHLKMVLRPRGGERFIDAIAFNAGELFGAAAAGSVRVAYRLEVNDYAGSRSAQLVMRHLEPAA